MIFKGLTLDKFQEDAVHAIENNESVVVSAPTGSGKTLIADYIIDRDLKEHRRVIYTAPIKALSNQKYRDFCEDYGEENIGILTGDVVINPRAPVLIMTTEVYRNMVLVHDPTVWDISYVVFDEIHFINDPERGYVWEESIIYSPSHVRFLCLSATIPNCHEFASWIKSIKEHDVKVVRHDIRSVPLEHYFYDIEFGLKTLDKLKQVADVHDIPEYGYVMGKRGKKRRRQQMPEPDHKELVSILWSRKEVPLLFFTFSRKQCEMNADDLGRKKNFLTTEERSKVAVFLSKEFSKMSPELLQLKSTSLLRRLLGSGIGFHHAGVLPSLKHVVEKLFGMGLIKVLYATETFAVGINMPAKVVCFASLRKYDGRNFRFLNSKEYFQLAGRAGRRGIDKVGKAVSMIDRRWFDYGKIKAFTEKDVEPIVSQFRLSFNTVLNLIKLHSDEEIMKILPLSFDSYQRYGKEYSDPRNIGAAKGRYTKMKKKLTAMGYVTDDSKLTWKGEFASHIFSDELITSETFGSEMWKHLDEYKILLLLGALSFEMRRGVQFFKVNPDKHSIELQHMLYKHNYLRKEKRFEMIAELTAVLRPMYHGKGFVELLKTNNVMEGNLIRFFRQILDRIGQIKNAPIEDELRFKLNNVAQLVDKCLEGVFEI